MRAFPRPVAESDQPLTIQHVPDYEKELEKELKTLQGEPTLPRRRIKGVTVRASDVSGQEAEVIGPEELSNEVSLLEQDLTDYEDDDQTAPEEEVVVVSETSETQDLDKLF